MRVSLLTFHLRIARDVQPLGRFCAKRRPKHLDESDLLYLRYEQCRHVLSHQVCLEGVSCPCHADFGIESDGLADFLNPLADALVPFLDSLGSLLGRVRFGEYEGEYGYPLLRFCGVAR